jgi:hypothetical protein
MREGIPWWLKSEIAFTKWIGQALVFVELEDWRTPIVHRDRGRRVLREQYPHWAGLIDEWEKQGINATPDYLLKVKGEPILWVDIKHTQKISNPFNLDARKYIDYLQVSRDTSTPASIVVFEKRSRVPKMWGYILGEQYNHIPLKNISTFEPELRRLTKLGL